jgi:hypothetical protein
MRAEAVCDLRRHGVRAQSQSLLDKLVRSGYATVSDCLRNRAELYRVRHRALYRAINQPHSRHRRPAPARHVIDRLMRLDAIALQPDLIWLATEEEKVTFFSLMAPSLPRERLPHLMVGKGARGRLRLSRRTNQSAWTTTGRVVFTYLVTAWETETLRAFVQRHADLQASISSSSPPVRRGPVFRRGRGCPIQDGIRFF